MIQITYSNLYLGGEYYRMYTDVEAAQTGIVNELTSTQSPGKVFVSRVVKILHIDDKDNSVEIPLDCKVDLNVSITEKKYESRNT